MTTVSLVVLDNDGEVADRLARELRTELLSLDIDSAELASREAPPGAKTDADTIATIVVSLSGSPVLVQLGRVLRDWVNRHNNRKLVVRDGDRSIEVTGYDAEAVVKFLSRGNERT